MLLFSPRYSVIVISIIEPLCSGSRSQSRIFIYLYLSLFFFIFWHGDLSFYRRREIRNKSTYPLTLEGTIIGYYSLLNIYNRWGMRCIELRYSIGDGVSAAVIDGNLFENRSRQSSNLYSQSRKLFASFWRGEDVLQDWKLLDHRIFYRIV